MEYLKNEVMIGIAGKRGSGKDTFADAFMVELDKVFNHRFKRMRFAQPLLDDLSRLGFTYPDTLEGKESAYAVGITHRGVVTSYSDWAKAIFGGDVFFQRSKAEALGETAVVFTDVRLPFEVDLIRENGLLIHIISDNDQAPTGHRTEAGVPIDDDKDIVIYNNFRSLPDICTIDALHSAAAKAANAIHSSFLYAIKQARI
jgi:hypothetical protein